MLTTANAETIWQAADKILGNIIDSWYENVSSFYITSEQVANLPGQQGTEELKRFHDDKGHRIKFNKGDLDSWPTTGTWEARRCRHPTS